MILITGGAGYIGSHTLAYFLAQGEECVVFDNLVYGHREAVPQEVPFVQGDLADVSALKHVFETYPITAVIHFAAFACVPESVQNPERYYYNNVVGTLNLLQVMHKFGVDKIVFSSTCAVYGVPEKLPLDETHPTNPISPYGRSKLMIEQIFADYRTAWGLNYAALRYFNAAGALKDGSIGESHQPENHLIPIILQTLQKGEAHFKIFGTDYDTRDGTCVRDYIHVEDLASAHYKALGVLDHFSGALNLGTGIGTTVREMFDAAEKVTGRTCQVDLCDRRPGDPPMLYAANAKAKEVLDWTPKWMDIKDILASAWNWEQNRRY